MIDYKPIVSFVIGGGIGSFITYFIVKKKYDKEKRDEINEIRNLYIYNIKFLLDKIDKEKSSDDLDNSERTLNTNSESEVKKILHHYNEEDDSDFNEYIDKVSNYNPNNIRPITEEIKQITEDEFGEEFDYDTITLYYYSDGVLADSNDNIIDNANTILVPNFEKRFENDVLFIRNHRLQSDFEILKMSNKTYSEISE